MDLFLAFRGSMGFAMAPTRSTFSTTLLCLTISLGDIYTTPGYFPPSPHLNFFLPSEI